MTDDPSLVSINVTLLSEDNLFKRLFLAARVAWDIISAPRLARGSKPSDVMPEACLQHDEAVKP